MGGGRSSAARPCRPTTRPGATTSYSASTSMATPARVLARRIRPAGPAWWPTSSAGGTARCRRWERYWPGFSSRHSVIRMTLDGDYKPSPSQWVRDQVAEYEASGGQRANTLADSGLPVVIVTTRGNKSGKIRKTPLMRVEHDGDYALVASK